MQITAKGFFDRAYKKSKYGVQPFITSCVYTVIAEGNTVVETAEQDCRGR